MLKQFDADRTGTGTAEWAEVTENIVRGCPNGCLYCYAAHNANRFGLRPRGDWQTEEFTKRASMKSYPARDGVVMFPSSHDITPFSVETYIRVAKLMLTKGNRLLIVSKPNPSCIRRVVEELAGFQDQILFRFTIGTVDAEISAFWEPGAPTPENRLVALRMAAEAGFRTSVSAEPLLGNLETAVAVLNAVRPYVTDTVWIGKLNKPRLRVLTADPEVASRVSQIERMQTDEEVERLYLALNGDPMVRWKDSVKDAMVRVEASNLR